MDAPSCGSGSHGRVASLAWVDAVLRATLAVAMMAHAALAPLPGQTCSMRVAVPSPTAASLGELGDAPVSLYTGVTGPSTFRSSRVRGARLSCRSTPVRPPAESRPRRSVAGWGSYCRDCWEECLHLRNPTETTPLGPIRHNNRPSRGMKSECLISFLPSQASNMR